MNFVIQCFKYNNLLYNALKTNRDVTSNMSINAITKHHDCRLNSFYNFKSKKGSKLSLSSSTNKKTVFNRHAFDKTTLYL